LRYTYGTENLIIRSWGEGAEVHIGSFCSIADNVQLFLGGNHRTDWATTYPFGHIYQDVFKWHGEGHPATKGDITIGNDVWLGSGCTIMSGVTIGDGAVVSANSTVVKDVPAYAIVGGNPAKVVKHRFTEKQIEKLMENPWWLRSDQEIQELIPLLCSSNIDDLIAKLSEPR
jgi:acetyltransferase-like isoleucine patch superfamily enzyme